MRPLRFLILSQLLCVLLFGFCIGDDYGVPDPATTVKFDFAEWCKVGVHKFTFEKETLGDVARALGGGQIVNVNANDPGNADPLWAVYYRSGKNVVRFEADGDMGGPEHRLTGISIGPARDFPRGQFPLIAKEVEFQFGHVGMDFSDLARQMGSAKLQGGKAIFEYSGTTGMPSRTDILGASKKYDVSGYLAVKIVEGKTIKMVMSHITTY